MTVGCPATVRKGRLDIVRLFRTCSLDVRRRFETDGWISHNFADDRWVSDMTAGCKMTVRCQEVAVGCSLGQLDLPAWEPETQKHVITARWNMLRWQEWLYSKHFLPRGQRQEQRQPAVRATVILAPNKSNHALKNNQQRIQHLAFRHPSQGRVY